MFLSLQACLQVADSDWSDKFSLDTVGSSGTITCKNKASGVYEVTESILTILELFCIVLKIL